MITGRKSVNVRLTQLTSMRVSRSRSRAAGVSSRIRDRGLQFWDAARESFARIPKDRKAFTIAVLGKLFALRR
jgi:hypothetical protein